MCLRFPHLSPTLLCFRWALPPLCPSAVRGAGAGRGCLPSFLPPSALVCLESERKVVEVEVAQAEPEVHSRSDGTVCAHVLPDLACTSPPPLPCMLLFPACTYMHCTLRSDSGAAQHSTDQVSPGLRPRGAKRSAAICRLLAPLALPPRLLLPNLR